MNEQDIGSSAARYEVEARDPKGNLVRATVYAGEIRSGCAEMARSFDERTRCVIVETAQKLGGSVRSIKRID